MDLDVTPTLDIVIPVFNEGENIIATLEGLRTSIAAPFRVLLCHDSADDNTLTAIATYKGVDIVAVRNRGSGASDAVRTGLAFSLAPAVLVFPADDDYNGPIIGEMVARALQGDDIVVASRFMRGGTMVGCPFVKAVLVRVAAYALHHGARLPTHDPTNGLRLFSRRVVDRVPIESTRGFAFSLELLVKCHRLRWPISEVPAQWVERRHGKSRFKILRWVPEYLRWFWFAFATTWLRRGPDTVRLGLVHS